MKENSKVSVITDHGCEVSRLTESSGPSDTIVELSCYARTFVAKLARDRGAAYMQQISALSYAWIRPISATDLRS